MMVIDNTKVNGGRVLYLISDSFGRALHLYCCLIMMRLLCMIYAI